RSTTICLRQTRAAFAARASRDLKEVVPATLDELTAIVEAIEQRFKLMALLAGWCGLRLGELTELRRSDIDKRAQAVHVRRAVTWVDGSPVVGPPKSDAGKHTVAI